MAHISIDIEFAIWQAAVLVTRHIPRPGKYNIRDIIDECSNYQYANDVNLQVHYRCVYNGLVLCKKVVEGIHWNLIKIRKSERYLVPEFFTFKRNAVVGWEIEHHTMSPFSLDPISNKSLEETIACVQATRAYLLNGLRLQSQYLSQNDMRLAIPLDLSWYAYFEPTVAEPMVAEAVRVEAVTRKKKRVVDIHPDYHRKVRKTVRGILRMRG
jgi:hypothetical protein